MDREEFLQRICRLRMAPGGEGKRHPQKPLFILWLLGRFQQTGSSACTYADAEAPVSRLIDEFGLPAKGKYRAAMPFFHLESELWTLSGSQGMVDSRSSLLKCGAHGRFADDLEQLLTRQPDVVIEAAHLLVSTYFTPTYLQPLCSEVGLDLGADGGLFRYEVHNAKKRARRAGFRTEVLQGWRFRCAMCGYDGAMGRDAAALDAAHIFWHSAGGPDSANNGLALCSLHHVLFDLGAIGLTDSLTMQVSPRFVARSEQAERLVYDLHGRELLTPSPVQSLPLVDNVKWHREQVFRPEAY